MVTSVDREQRRADRRAAERRTAGRAVDVSRIEHENLTGQVAANVRALRRIEQELRNLRSLIEQINGLKDAG
jgi:hypothetical protein